MPDDESYHAVLSELSKLSEAWRIHREVINRAISLLNHEVIGMSDRIDKDDADRVRRQQQVDQQFDVIRQQFDVILSGMRVLKRWSWIRIGIELAAIVVILAFVIGRSL